VQALIFANRGREAAAVAKRESLRLRAPGHFCACYPRWSLTGSEIGTIYTCWGIRNHRRRRKVAITLEVNCAAPGSLLRRSPIVRITLLLFRERPSRYERDTKTCRPIIWSRPIGVLGPRERQHVSA